MSILNVCVVKVRSKNIIYYSRIEVKLILFFSLIHDTISTSSICKEGLKKGVV